MDQYSKEEWKFRLRALLGVGLFILAAAFLPKLWEEKTPTVNESAPASSPTPTPTPTPTVTAVLEEFECLKSLASIEYFTQLLDLAIDDISVDIAEASEVVTDKFFDNPDQFEGNPPTLWNAFSVYAPPMFLMYENYGNFVYLFEGNVSENFTLLPRCPHFRGPFTVCSLGASNLSMLDLFRDIQTNHDQLWQGFLQGWWLDGEDNSVAVWSQYLEEWVRLEEELDATRLSKKECINNELIPWILDEMPGDPFNLVEQFNGELAARNLDEIDSFLENR